jgi:hypothetical protein
MPGSAAALDFVKIEIQIIERDGEGVGGAVEPGYESISVRVKVTSRQESPRLLVEPRRFRLEADGVEVPARPAARKEPSLRSTYVPAGKSVGGWITFEPPVGAKRLMLKSDLRRPPISMPLMETPGAGEE